MAAEPTILEVAEPAPTKVGNKRTIYHGSKRLFDVLGATVLLLILSPIWIAAACMVRLSSDGPVLFRQRRVGLDGNEFTCFKFRTMVHDADALRMHLSTSNEKSGPIFKLRFDPRTTSVGRFLRKSSIDELPQLLNVLRGSMSIVGPRPPLPEEVVHYSDYQLRRLSVRPGMTCIWQVSGRSNIDFDEWVELDLEYIRRRSFWLDIWLILRTIPAVITGRGAY